MAESVTFAAWEVDRFADAIRLRFANGIVELVQSAKTAVWGPVASGYDSETPDSPDMADPAKGIAGPTGGSLPSAAMETTLDLLVRAKAGDSDAVERLFERCLPSLRRWARGRLPRYARDLADTQDLVQETMLHALRRMETFEPRHQGALQAYLRQAVANRIRDEIRRVTRRPIAEELTDGHPDLAPSPLEHAIGRQGIEAYEAALGRLRASDREAIIARIELQQSYEEIAVALGRPNANAARVAVMRALARLVEEMDHER
jgi:RNA polymerase sigma-70 factor, ECF subfamily